MLHLISRTTKPYVTAFNTSLTFNTQTTINTVRTTALKAKKVNNLSSTINLLVAELQKIVVNASLNSISKKFSNKIIWKRAFQGLT